MTTRFAQVLLCLALAGAAASASAGGPWRAAESNTAGWEFMSPDERVEHQRRMRSFTTYEACLAYQAEHHARIAERARQAGAILAPKAESGCERLRARGRLR